MSWQQRAKRKARIARKRWRAAHPPTFASFIAILKAKYPQARVYALDYKGPRILGGKFARRYNPANRERKYAPWPFEALLERDGKRWWEPGFDAGGAP